MKKGERINSRGQITAFIIAAVIIVVIGILLYMFAPAIRTGLGLESKNPADFIQSCIEEDIQNSADELSLQGGSIKPEHYFLYDNSKLEYLCYTNEYYLPCIVQQPMLKEHIQREIKNNIQSKASDCFNDLKTSFERRGYDVNLRKGNITAELLPKRIVVTFNNKLTLVKDDSSETHNTIQVVLNNNLYELASIANSILNWETRFGDAETTVYMNYYHDLKVEKKKQSDGTTVYILTDRNTEKKFQFASRSVAWPAGY